MTKKRVSITVSNNVLKRVDEVKGPISRSSWIEEAMKRRLEDATEWMGIRKDLERMKTRKKLWKALKEGGFVKGYKGLEKLFEDTFHQEAPSSTTIRRKFVKPLERRKLIEIEEGKGRAPHRFYVPKNTSFKSSNP